MDLGTAAALKTSPTSMRGNIHIPHMSPMIKEGTLAISAAGDMGDNPAYITILIRGMAKPTRVTAMWEKRVRGTGLHYTGRLARG